MGADQYSLRLDPILCLGGPSSTDSGLSTWRERRPACGRPTIATPILGWPASHSEMAKRIHSFSWEATSLGDPRGWPSTLRTAVDLILDSPLPQIVLLGPELIQIYNDSYAIVMDAKHPSGLGQPTSECWPEVWPFNREHYAAVMNGDRTRSGADRARAAVPAKRQNLLRYGARRGEVLNRRSDPPIGLEEMTTSTHKIACQR
jgi:hypothetical protein